MTLNELKAAQGARQRAYAAADAAKAAKKAAVGTPSYEAALLRYRQAELLEEAATDNLTAIARQAMAEIPEFVALAKKYAGVNPQIIASEIEGFETVEALTARLEMFAAPVPTMAPKLDDGGEGYYEEGENLGW